MSKPLPARITRLTVFLAFIATALALYSCSDKLTELAGSTAKNKQNTEIESLKAWCGSLDFVKKANDYTTNQSAGASQPGRLLRLDWAKATERERPNGLGKVWLVPVKKFGTTQAPTGLEIGERFVLFYKNAAITANIVEVLTKPSGN